MRVVSETSEEDLARQRAAERLRQAKDALGQRLRDLTANLIRIARGAGEPLSIGNEVDHLRTALLEYQAVEEYWKIPEMSEMLSWQTAWDLPGDEFEEAILTEQVIKGALRIVAARLAGGALQERLGLKDMDTAIGQLEHARSQRRLKRLAEQRALAPAKPMRRLVAKKPGVKKKT